MDGLGLPGLGLLGDFLACPALPLLGPTLDLPLFVAREGAHGCLYAAFGLVFYSPTPSRPPIIGRSWLPHTHRSAQPLALLLDSLTGLHPALLGLAAEVHRSGTERSWTPQQSPRSRWEEGSAGSGGSRRDLAAG